MEHKNVSWSRRADVVGNSTGVDCPPRQNWAENIIHCLYTIIPIRKLSFIAIHDNSNQKIIIHCLYTIIAIRKLSFIAIHDNINRKRASKQLWGNIYFAGDSTRYVISLRSSQTKFDLIHFDSLHEKD